MKDIPGPHRGYLLHVGNSTAIVPPRRYSIKRLNELRQKCSGALDLEKFSHAALQAGVLKTEIIMPYVTMVDGPLSEVPANYRRGLAAVTTRGRRPTEDLMLLDDDASPQLGEAQSLTPESSLVKQDEGFARFLKTHSSPTHQRVTAGGRIVPMEAIPPPQFRSYGNSTGREDLFKMQGRPARPNTELPQTPAFIGSSRRGLNDTSTEPIHQYRASGTNEKPISSDQGKNLYVGSPMLAPMPVAAPSINSTAWWGHLNQHQRSLGTFSPFHTPFPMHSYPVPGYPSATPQAGPTGGWFNMSSGPALLDTPQDSSHNSGSAFSPPLMTNALPTTVQPVHSDGSGVMYAPFSPVGGSAGACSQPPLRNSILGNPGSYGRIAPDGRTGVATDPNMLMPVSINKSVPISTPNTVEQARQQYTAITQRIEQFNKDVVLQNLALDHVQQNAIAKYRLDMATERARAHKTLKALEVASKTNKSHDTEASANGHENGNTSENRPRVQFHLPANSPSRGLNVEAPVWEPHNHSSNSTLLVPSPSELPVAESKAGDRPLSPGLKAESQGHLDTLERATDLPSSGINVWPTVHHTLKRQSDNETRQLQHVAGIGPLGLADCPILEPGDQSRSDGNTSRKLPIETANDRCRSDPLPADVITDPVKENGELGNAAREGASPNRHRSEQAVESEYLMSLLAESGHFGPRKELREAFAREPEEKRKRGPSGSELNEWDKRFDAARHYHGVETLVWTEKRGWLTCRGQDLMQPGPEDIKSMTDYERRYWIRKPDSSFKKFQVDDIRIEDMENIDDRCSRWSVDDNATVYSDDSQWIDLQMQDRRLIAAGEDPEMAIRAPPEELYLQDGKESAMEEYGPFLAVLHQLMDSRAQASWRGQIEARKKYRNSHKMHPSRRCPKHAQVKAAKNEQIRSWLDSLNRGSIYRNPSACYKIGQVSHQHVNVDRHLEGKHQSCGSGRVVASGLCLGLEPMSRLGGFSDSRHYHTHGNGRTTIIEPDRHNFGPECRYHGKNGGSVSTAQNCSGCGEGESSRAAENTASQEVSPKSNITHHHNEAQCHKGVSSVCVSPDIAKATANTAAQRKTDTHASLIKRLKTLSVPREDEEGDEAGISSSIENTKGVRLRFPFRGNKTRFA